MNTEDMDNQLPQGMDSDSGGDPGGVLFRQEMNDHDTIKQPFNWEPSPHSAPARRLAKFDEDLRAASSAQELTDRKAKGKKAPRWTKNALIINGQIYVAKRSLFTPFSRDVCDKCDLKRRCNAHCNSYFCAPFEKNGYVPYFKKVGWIPSKTK